MEHSTDPSGSIELILLLGQLLVAYITGAAFLAAEAPAVVVPGAAR